MMSEPYWDWTDQIKALMREGRLSEVETLLLRTVNATERESARATEQWGEPFGVAPWAYGQLAILYAKQGRYADEVAILERYEKQPKAPGAGPRKLAERLRKAKARLEKKAHGA